jgi:hypothetical protein
VPKNQQPTPTKRPTLNKLECKQINLLRRNKDALGYLAQGVLFVTMALGSTGCALPAESDPLAPGDRIDGTTGGGLRILRARLMTEQLAEQWKIQLPEFAQEFGDEIPATFVLPNPFARPFRLIEPKQGFIVQLDWRIERWLPYAAKEILSQRQTGTLDRLLEFTPDQVVQYTMQLPLGQAGENSALWRVHLRGVLRCDGLEIDGEVFPVAKIVLKGGSFLVLPGNWQSLQDDPLASLEKLITVSDPQVDRHLLVAAALLPAIQKESAMGLLVNGLDVAPSLRRMDTIMGALRFLSGRDFGESPSLWKAWWRKRKIAQRD